MGTNSSSLLVYTGEELLLREVIGHHSNDRVLLEEALLAEGMISADVVKDVVQYVVSTAAEWGVGTGGAVITIPVAGGGAAAGPIVETVVDTLFGAEAVAAAVATISNAKDMAGEYASLISNSFNAYDPGNFKGFYDKLKMLVQKLLSAMKGVAKKVDQVVDEIKEVLQKMIAAIVRPIEKAIQFVIPESTIGVAAAKAAAQILQALAENAYSGITAVIKQFDWLQKFVEDPSSAQAFFKDITKQLINLMRKAADHIEDSKLADTWWKKAAMVASPGALLAGMFTKGYGPTLFRKAADALEKFAPKMLDMLDKILNVVIPYMFTCLALFQIFMKGDHKAKSKDDEKNKEGGAPKNKKTGNSNYDAFAQGQKDRLAASYYRKGNSKVVLENKLRKVIRLRLLEASRNSSVELTMNPSRSEVAAAWPAQVFHNGQNVFDKFYNSPGGGAISDALDWLSREGYDGQEVYLGYDPQSNNFVMGFDAFYEGYDSYGNTIQDSEMEGVLILLDPNGRALETITSVPGGIYPRGIQAAKRAMPEIIDVRLD